MELSLEQELEAAIARRMPAARRLFGHQARMRWRGTTVQVGFFTEYGFHVRGSSYIPPTITAKNIGHFRMILDEATTSAIDSVRRFADDPAPK